MPKKPKTRPSPPRIRAVPKRANPWRPRPTSIRLHREMRKRLMEYARKRRRPLSWIIIEMIEQAFERIDGPPETGEIDGSESGNRSAQDSA
jgi:predicted transcriptional regulator